MSLGQNWTICSLVRKTAKAMKKIDPHTILLIIGAILVTLLVLASWLLWGGVSNPRNRSRIGEISVPRGYERVSVDPDSFGEFIRDFPLQKRGSHMKYYNGDLAYGQYFGYAVLDLPMLANTEQCADAVMRMRAEYLWNKGLYRSVHFHSVSGKDQKYCGNADRKAFEKYLRGVFDNSNTSSLRREMKPKAVENIAPGDVFVYESPGTGSYGHAVLVVDVAINKKTGKKAIMLAQSSTPALTMHIIRDFFHPILSPWVVLEDASDGFSISGIHFEMSDLRSW